MKTLEEIEAAAMRGEDVTGEFKNPLGHKARILDLEAARKYALEVQGQRHPGAEKPIVELSLLLEQACDEIERLRKGITTSEALYIQQLYKNATPTPWRMFPTFSRDKEVSMLWPDVPKVTSMDGSLLFESSHHGKMNENAELVANVINLVPRMLGFPAPGLEVAKGV